ncbi:7349_t:CDS:2 [Ambispora gerdemannii]|uniref:7349_t:CDS:1 n=1 Tax=Ambispora gerdemannii TaxID=144530 RepID=A0A9N8VSN6_9GLOM|nr:7349_t:CDS:2 [Ambispora gerdemannii]
MSTNGDNINNNDDKQTFTMLYFASARDITKVSSEKIPISSDPNSNSDSLDSNSLSINQLTNLLLTRYPGLKPILEHSMYAVNMVYVEKNENEVKIRPDDEVAIIPPVSGG